MLAELVMMAKDLVGLLWWVLLGAILLYFIISMFMGIYKTVFCDVQVKLYKTWKKRLKHHMNDEEVERIINEVEKKNGRKRQKSR